MARQTFQAKLRTTAGTPRSVPDRRTGIPANVLTQTLAGPIQFSTVGLPVGTPVEIGMLPAYFALQEAAVIAAATAGTIEIKLPAYAGLAEVSLVAAGGSLTTLGPLVLAAPVYSSFSTARPIEVTVTGVTGTAIVGLFGFPLDDARSISN